MKGGNTLPRRGLRSRVVPVLHEEGRVLVTTSGECNCGDGDCKMVSGFRRHPADCLGDITPDALSQSVSQIHRVMRSVTSDGSDPRTRIDVGVLPDYTQDAGIPHRPDIRRQTVYTCGARAACPGGRRSFCREMRSPWLDTRLDPAATLSGVTSASISTRDGGGRLSRASFFASRVSPTAFAVSCSPPRSLLGGVSYGVRNSFGVSC